MPTVAAARTRDCNSIAVRGGAAAARAGALAPMLMDSVLERLIRARDYLEQGRFPEHGQLLQTALRLLGELRSSLDLYDADAYAVNLDDICDYISRRLVASCPHNRVATLDEVSHLLREIRSAWLMYV